MLRYHKKYLPITILFESFRLKPIRAIFRPHAYIDGASKYSCECQIDSPKKEIYKGDELVLKATLLSPVGFGEHLKIGTLLTLRDGVEVVGKAVVLEIN
ncbi:MAG: hypothetical protein J0M08_12340 [Bacteroidetes bacterium]|nr:hypothetical protein [Bacteroidota bacterium]